MIIHKTKMHRFIFSLLAVVLILFPASLALGQDTSTATPSGTPAEPSSTGLVAQEFTLRSLNIRDSELFSPQGSTQFGFHVPENWSLGGVSSLNLQLDYFKSGKESELAITELQVEIDGALVSTLTLPLGESGSQQFTIPLDNAVINNPLRRVHTVRVILDARDQCLSNQQVRIQLRSEKSYFRFEYTEIAPMRDLSSLPRPFYDFPLGRQTETALLVLPANYTPSDLDLAASVAATFGKLSDYSLRLKTTTTDTITEDEKADENLLLVGQIGNHPMIDDLYNSGVLPTRLESDTKLFVHDQAIAPDDGAIQIIANPRNPLKSILVITGTSAAGVTKATRALSTPSSLVGVLNGTLALISEVQPPAPMKLNENLTFTALGYDDVLLAGVGTRTTDIQVVIPAGTTVTDQAYVELEFDYPETLRHAQTVLSVSLNNTPLQSITLGESIPQSDATAVQSPQVNRLRALIPPATIVPGADNRLTLTLDIQGNWKCFPPNESVAWFSVRGSSKFYLPRQPINMANFAPRVSWFPVPFSGDRDLRSTLLVLPTEPSLADIDLVIQFVARLGSETPNGAAFAPRIVFGAIPSDIDPANYHLIVFGRPSTNPLLRQLNDGLPQPFAPDTDELKQVFDNVTYRLPLGYDIGLLEMLNSPWSPEHSILVIAGTGAQGPIKAMNVLLSLNYDRSELNGNVVFASSTAISTINTTDPDAMYIMGTDIPSLATEVLQVVTPAGTAEDTNNTPTPLFTAQPTIAPPTPLPTFEPLPTDAVEPEAVEQPVWVYGLIAVTVLISIVSVAFGVITLLRSRRKEQA